MMKRLPYRITAGKSGDTPDISAEFSSKADAIAWADYKWGLSDTEKEFLATRGWTELNLTSDGADICHLEVIGTLSQREAHAG